MSGDLKNCACGNAAIVELRRKGETTLAPLCGPCLSRIAPVRPAAPQPRETPRG